MNIMKKFISFIVLGFLFHSFCFSQVSDQKSTESFKVKVFFHCANGKALIEKKLGEIKEIESVVADLETKIVTVTYNSGSLTHEKIIEYIEGIGYYTEFSDQTKPIKKACSHGEGEEEHNHQH